MTKSQLLILFAITFVAAACVTVMAAKRKEKIAKASTFVMLFASTIVLSYVIILSNNSYFWNSFGESLLFISMDWMCASFLMYSVGYTNIGVKKVIPKVILGIAIADSLLMAVNPFYEIAISYNTVYTQNGDMFLIFEPRPLYHFHLFFCYALIVATLVFLIIKTAKVPGFYKVKYILIIAVILIVVAANAIYIVSKIKADYSVLSYAVAALLVYDLTFVSTPRMLNKKLQKLIIDSSEKGVLIYDYAGENSYYNAEAKKLFGEDVNLNCVEFSRKILKQELPGNKEKAEIQLGNEIYYRAAFEKICDKKGNQLAAVFQFSDVSVYRMLAREVDFNTNHDELTHLWKMKHFMSVFQREKEEHLKDQAVMIVIDIEKLRYYNEVFGIEFMNDALKALAKEISVYGDAHSMHYGRMVTDCFAMYGWDTSLDVSEIAGVLRDTLYEYSKDIPINLKIGVFRSDIYNVQTIYKRASIAAKEYDSDQGAYTEFDTKLMESTERKAKLQTDFQRSLVKGEFDVYLQPQIDSKGNRLVGAEALVRWLHPEFGVVSPSEFVPELEKNRVIHNLDRYVWEKAAEYTAELHKKGINIPVSVNVSILDIMSINIPKVLPEIIAKNGLQNSDINIEVTESVFISKQKRVVESINKLRELGFKVEIDDFGSGYSSLNVLKEVPCDTVKLDMKFMMGDYAGEKGISILRDIIRLIGNINLNVIAEGVETDEQIKMLGDMDCNHIQGYYYSKPLPFDEFVDFGTKFLDSLRITK